MSPVPRSPFRVPFPLRGAARGWLALCAAAAVQLVGAAELAAAPAGPAQALLAAASDARAASPAAAPSLGPATIAVESGRVRVAERSLLQRLGPGENRAVEGPLYLETGPGTAFDLSWPGLGSVRALGTVVLEWSDPTALRLRFLAGGELFLEFRRGDALVELPLGWELEIPPGAFYAKGLANSATEFHVDAAGPVRVETSVDPQWPRPPVLLRQGARVRFEGRRRLHILSGVEHVVHDARALLEPGTTAVRERATRAWSADQRSFLWPWGSRPPTAEPLGGEVAPAPVAQDAGGPHGQQQPRAAVLSGSATAPELEPLRAIAHALADDLSVLRRRKPGDMQIARRALASVLRQAFGR